MSPGRLRRRAGVPHPPIGLEYRAELVPRHPFAANTSDAEYAEMA